MNLHQPIAAVLALAITFAGLAGISHYGDTAASSSAHPFPASAAVTATLPTIEVRPSPAQVEMLRKERTGSHEATQAQRP